MRLFVSFQMLATLADMGSISHSLTLTCEKEKDVPRTTRRNLHEDICVPFHPYQSSLASYPSASCLWSSDFCCHGHHCRQKAKGTMWGAGLWQVMSTYWQADAAGHASRKWKPLVPRSSRRATREVQTDRPKCWRKMSMRRTRELNVKLKKCLSGRHRRDGRPCRRSGVGHQVCAEPLFRSWAR